MWLLTPYLENRYRIVTFFKALPVLAAFSMLAFVPALLTRSGGWLDLRGYLAALLALASLAATLALTLAGFSVRRRFGRRRFLVWLTVWTALAWMVIASPLFTIGTVNGDIEWGPALLAMLYVTASSLALLLPLLLLSFFQPFYRARLFGFLKAPQPGPSAGAAVPLRMAEAYQFK